MKMTDLPSTSSGMREPTDLRQEGRGSMDFQHPREANVYNRESSVLSGAEVCPALCLPCQGPQPSRSGKASGKRGVLAPLACLDPGTQALHHSPERGKRWSELQRGCLFTNTEGYCHFLPSSWTRLAERFQPSIDLKNNS